MVELHYMARPIDSLKFWRWLAIASFSWAVMATIVAISFGVVINENGWFVAFWQTFRHAMMPG